MNHGQSEATSDPRLHGENIQRQLDELITHAREDVQRIDEPRMQALLETTAEVLAGLKTAYQHYAARSEAAWQAPERRGS